jgi:hypothetical protein
LEVAAVLLLLSALSLLTLGRYRNPVTPRRQTGLAAEQAAQ